MNLTGDWKIGDQGQTIQKRIEENRIMIPTVDSALSFPVEYTIEKDAFNCHRTYNRDEIPYRGIYKWNEWFEMQDDLNDKLFTTIQNGPANRFFERLDEFNNSWRYNFSALTEEDELPWELEVYDKSLRWKRGSYDKLKQWMTHHFLQFRTRPAGIESIFQRMYNNQYMFERMSSSINQLEAMRRDAISSGFGRDVDEEAILECFDNYKNLPDQDLMNDHISFDYYIQDNQDMRKINGIIAITMKKEHFSMNVLHGNTQVATIPYKGDLQIIYKFPLLGKFADVFNERTFTSAYSKRDVGWSGRYALNTPYKFPWISGSGNRTLNANNSYNRLSTLEDALNSIHGGWNSVCWGGFSTDIDKAFYQGDHNTIIMALTEWGTIYNSVHSNPHNSIKYFHTGVTPEQGDFINDYRAIIGYNVADCHTIVSHFGNNSGPIDILPCDTCDLRQPEDGDTCHVWLNKIKPQTQNVEHKMMFIEQLCGNVEDVIEHYYSDTVRYGDALLKSGMEQLLSMQTRDLMQFVISELDQASWYGAEEIILEEDDDEASMEQVMERWAGPHPINPFDNVIEPRDLVDVPESTDETAELERQRIAARERLNNL